MLDDKSKKSDRPLSVGSFYPQNVYFQANTIDGFRIFDESGKILNKYAKEYEDVGISIQGVNLKSPKIPNSDFPFAITVEANRIWCNFVEPMSLGATLPQIPTLVRDVSKMLGVERYSRLGLRVEFVAEISSRSLAIRQLAVNALGTPFSEVISTSHGELDLQIMLKTTAVPKPVTKSVEINDLGVMLAVKKLRVARPYLRLGDYRGDGVAIDIDVFDSNEKSFLGLPIFIGQAKQRIDDILATSGGLLVRAMT